MAHSHYVPNLHNGCGELDHRGRACKLVGVVGARAVLCLVLHTAEGRGGSCAVAVEAYGERAVVGRSQYLALVWD